MVAARGRNGFSWRTIGVVYAVLYALVALYLQPPYVWTSRWPSTVLWATAAVMAATSVVRPSVRVRALWGAAVGGAVALRLAAVVWYFGDRTWEDRVTICAAWLLVAFGALEYVTRRP